MWKVFLLLACLFSVGQATPASTFMPTQTSAPVETDYDMKLNVAFSEFNETLFETQMEQLLNLSGEDGDACVVNCAGPTADPCANGGTPGTARRLLQTTGTTYVDFSLPSEDVVEELKVLEADPTSVLYTDPAYTVIGTADPTFNNPDDGLSDAVIVVIVLVCILAVVLPLLIFWLCKRKKEEEAADRDRAQEQDEFDQPRDLEQQRGQRREVPREEHAGVQAGGFDDEDDDDEDEANVEEAEMMPIQDSTFGTMDFASVFNLKNRILEAEADKGNQFDDGADETRWQYI